MKNAVFGMLRPVDNVRIDVSEERSTSIIQVTRIGELRSVRRLLVAADVPSSPILVTLMTEALCSSDESFLTRATRHNIPEGGIIYMEMFCKMSPFDS
jgi:hypothetical protein